MTDEYSAINNYYHFHQFLTGFTDPVHAVGRIVLMIKLLQRFVLYANDRRYARQGIARRFRRSASVLSTHLFSRYILMEDIAHKMAIIELVHQWLHRSPVNAHTIQCRYPPGNISARIFDFIGMHSLITVLRPQHEQCKRCPIGVQTKEIALGLFEIIHSHDLATDAIARHFLTADVFMVFSCGGKSG